MNKILLDKKNDYTLFIRLKETGLPVSCEPFVVAWKYDERNDSWAQGHYFTTLREATLFLYNRYTEYVFIKVSNHHTQYFSSKEL